MLLHRLHLNARCKEARRDLGDPYQLHATLCRAFSPEEQKCPPGTFLWRVEPETDTSGAPRILIQSHVMPQWNRIQVPGYFARDIDPAIHLSERLKVDQLKAGQRFRFRLRANPATSKDGKRLGLLKTPDQEAWLVRKGKEQHGFSLMPLVGFDIFDESEPRVDLRISQEQMLRGKKCDGKSIQVFSVLYDGILEVTDPEAFRKTLASGIGHGKTMGLGLLSVVPLS